MSRIINDLTHEAVFQQLEEISRKMLEWEGRLAEVLQALHPNYQLSGANLIHYLVLRSYEIRQTQEYLHQIGLSSLASSESHTLAQLLKVLKWLTPDYVQRIATPCTYDAANRLRTRFSEELLGASYNPGRPHIMVTISAEMATDRIIMEEMLEAGMTVARINCAHDHQEVWHQMIATLKVALAKTGRQCKIYMDLAGPKIRVRSILSRHVQRESVKISEGEVIYLTTSVHLDSLKVPNKSIVICAEPAEILTMIRKGERIYFDDGKFEGRVQNADPTFLEVKIVRISTRKPELKIEKGINLPDSELNIPALTPEDMANIPFICKYADMVGYSFVSTPADVQQLRTELRKHEVEKRPSLILKIERLPAVQNLPQLLFSGMKDPSFGIMIARGDLAVEIGFERLSEIQEEILWICEACHVPVIWATQVLETMNKTGFATRSEITDAAMSVKAECVMLNKGKHITKTIHMLDNVLQRQLGHFDKKRYIMRPLGIARNFLHAAVSQ